MHNERLKQIQFMASISKSAGAGWARELIEEVDRLREAIRTHKACSHECEKCGHAEPCSTDDVCLVLSNG